MGNIESTVLFICGTKNNKKPLRNQNGTEGENAKMNQDQEENEVLFYFSYINHE